MAVGPETGIVVNSIKNPQRLEGEIVLRVYRGEEFRGRVEAAETSAGQDEGEAPAPGEAKHRIQGVVRQIRDSGELLVLEIADEHVMNEWDSFEVFRDGKLITRVLVRGAVTDDPKKEFLRLDGGDELHVGDVVGLEVYEK